MKDFLFFRNGKRHYKVDLNSILYIQAEKRYIHIITEKKCFCAFIAIGDIEKYLPRGMFCRVHRSYIVSLQHTDEFDNELVLIGTKKIPISEQYINLLKTSVIVINGNRAPITFENDDVSRQLEDFNSYAHPQING